MILNLKRVLFFTLFLTGALAGTGAPASDDPSCRGALGNSGELSQATIHSLQRAILSHGSPDLDSELWRSVWSGFNGFLERMAQPLGHGTSLNYLPSILENGLGARKPNGSFSPDLNCLADLKKVDGLLAVYAFASKNKFDHLKFYSKNDVVARYSEVNPRFQSFIKRWLLRSVARHYVKKRGTDAFAPPLLLIYDGEGTAKCEYRSKSIPSEVNCLDPLFIEKLRIVFVPASFYELTEDALRRRGSAAVVLPLELLEWADLMAPSGRAETSRLSRS